VGETVKLEFKENSSMVIRIVELSDKQHFITWEVVEVNPPVGVSAVINKIKLSRVTDCDGTFMSWATEFSNDVES